MGVTFADGGISRVANPIQPPVSAPPSTLDPRQRELLPAILEDSGLSHVDLEFSWDDVAERVLASRDVTRRSAGRIDVLPD